MKKINLLVILFIFLISCGKAEKNTFDANKHELIEIKFAKAKIYAPKNYKKIFIENYIKILEEDNIKYNKKVWDYLAEIPLDKILLYDKNNKLNTILIGETDFIPLQKSNAKEIVSYLNSSFIYSEDSDVREYKKIENRYREFDNFRILKSKFLIVKPNVDIYQTIYLVSTINKSFTILHNSLKDENLDDGIINGI